MELWMQQLGATEDSGNCCDITMCSLESITGHGLQAELAERPAWETAAGMRVMRLWPQQGSLKGRLRRSVRMSKALPQPPVCFIPHSLLQLPGALGQSREWRQQATQIIFQM